MGYICEYCGGQFNHRENLWSHLKRERQKFVDGQEGVDYLVCRECGLRAENLIVHLGKHGLKDATYLEKYPGSVLVLPTLKRRMAEANKGTHTIPIPHRSGAVLCDKCNEWYLRRFAAKHLADCVAAHPDKYGAGSDYVACPECGMALTRLGGHLKKVHGWDADRIAVEVGRGLRMEASAVADRWRDGQDFAAAQKKREGTNLERHGYANPFSSPEAKAKMAETSQRRYGSDHPMQNEEVFARQQESAQAGPSEQESFFNEHTCPNVVFNGYGGRFIRTKTGVRKYGRVVKDLNPDFMVLPDNVLESALAASKERRRMDRTKHRTRYVVELLGDWYHSEKVIGVPPAEHSAELVAAYKSAGIECLVLWEKDVTERWNEIEPTVSAWIDKAVADMNARPVWRKSTASKVDGRKGTLVCPYGSGRRFRSPEKLARWLTDPFNYWRPGLVEGVDYVVCRVCGARCQKLTEHLRKSHGMSKEDYLASHPGADTVSVRGSEAASSAAPAERGRYRKHIAYRCPDGSVARKRDAWMRAWSPAEPPADSVLDAAALPVRDPFAGKVEGVDYVTCVCGYRGKNIARHVGREHGLADYAGPLRSERCAAALSAAADKAWDTKGRKREIEAGEPDSRLAPAASGV